MYIPRHFHWFGPVAILLIGFAVHNRYPTWDGSFSLVVLGIVAVEWGAYIWQAGVMYQGYLTQLDIKYGSKPEEPKSDGMPTQADDNLIPLSKTNGAHAPYETAIVLPKFDKERSFAITLLRMRDYNGKADLREEKWVKTKKFVRAEFVAMLENWMHYNIINREGERRNAPYVVVNWKAVELIAAGNPLPRRDLLQ